MRLGLHQPGPEPGQTTNRFPRQGNQVIHIMYLIRLRLPLDTPARARHTMPWTGGGIPVEGVLVPLTRLRVNPPPHMTQVTPKNRVPIIS